MYIHASSDDGGLIFTRSDTERTRKDRVKNRATPRVLS